MRELEGSKAPQTARRTPRARSRRGPEPASHPRSARQMTGPHPIFTWRSCFFKASFRRRTYYMNRSLSLPFTDRALPSAIRPSEVSYSRLARGAQDSRPRPADSHGAAFLSAPPRRPVSHPGAAKPIAGSPSPHRRGPPRLPTAAVLRLSGETAGRPAARRVRAPSVPAIRPNPPLDAPCASPPCRACRARAAALALPCR